LDDWWQGYADAHQVVAPFQIESVASWTPRMRWSEVDGGLPTVKRSQQIAKLLR